MHIDARVFDDNLHHVRGSQRVGVITPPTIRLIGSLANSYFNGGNAQIRRVETQVKCRLSKKTQVIANFSHVSISSNQSTVLPGGFTLSTSTNNFSALITHQFDNNWGASYAYYQTGAVTAKAMVSLWA